MKSAFAIVLMFLVGLSIGNTGSGGGYKRTLKCSKTSSKCFQVWKQLIAKISDDRPDEIITVCSWGGKPKGMLNGCTSGFFKGPVEIYQTGKQGHTRATLMVITKPTPSSALYDPNAVANGKIQYKIKL